MNAFDPDKLPVLVDARARVRAVRSVVRVGARSDLAEPVLRARRDVRRICRQPVPRIRVQDRVRPAPQGAARLGDLFPRFPARLHDQIAPATAVRAALPLREAVLSRSEAEHASRVLVHRAALFRFPALEGQRHAPAARRPPGRASDRRHLRVACASRRRGTRRCSSCSSTSTAASSITCRRRRPSTRTARCRRRRHLRSTVSARVCRRSSSPRGSSGAASTRRSTITARSSPRFGSCTGLGGPLTARDEAANTFTHLFRKTARRHAPRTLTRPAEPTADAFHADSQAAAMTPEHVASDLATGMASSAPLSEFQKSLTDCANALQVDPGPASRRRQPRAPARQRTRGRRPRQRSGGAALRALGLRDACRLTA